GDIYQRSGNREDALKTYSASLSKVGNGTWLEKEILGQIEQVFRKEDDIAGLKGHYEKLIETDGKRVMLWRKNADLLAELGDHDEAVTAFKEILTLTPGDRAIEEEYIDLLTRLEKTEEAIKQLNQLIEQNAGDGELLLKLAAVHHKSADSDKTGESLKRYLELSDKSEYAYLRTAQLLERYELNEDAEQVFKQLQEAFPESTASNEAFAAYLYRQEKKEEALNIWKGLAAKADRPDVVRISRTLAQRNESEAAFEILEGRHADFPDDAVFLNQLCSQAVQVKQFDRALPWARTLLKKAKNAIDLETAMALTIRVLDGSDGEEALRAELEEKALPQEQCLLAELYERAGEPAKAEKLLTNLPEAHATLAANQMIRLHRQRNDWEAAARAAVDLIELPGGRRSANVQKAVELFQQADQLDEALKWIPEWKKLSPGSTLAWMVEARILIDQGKPGEAIKTLRMASQQFDDNEDIRALLAEVYTMDGKMADASRIFLRLYEDSKDVSARMSWVQQMAQVAEYQGKTRTLLEQFEERRKNNRGSILPLLALAEIHRVSNNYEDRRRCLMEATRIKPNDLDLLLEIARIEESEGDFDKALATLKEATTLDKTDRTRERMARLHFGMGNDEEGFAILYDLAGGKNADEKTVENLAQAMIAT
ncbi:MAG: tetratricopeptide repeat protein, partial [Verrucomicrobiota bacterium]